MLKEKLTAALVLTWPTKSGGFTIFTDGSKLGLGYVLMQNDKVVAYGSRQLKDHKLKYVTYDLELPAVVFTFKIWRHYFYGERFEVLFYYRSL